MGGAAIGAADVRRIAMTIAMTKVTAQMSLSVDGCYAGPAFTGGPKDVAGWMQSPEALGFFRITRWVTDAAGWRERQGFAGGERSVSSEIVEESFAAAGAYVMGRRMFEGGEIPWGDDPPFRAPVFVVTHRPHEVVERQGGTSFTFVTGGVEQAVKMAREAAGDKDVAVAGGGTLLRHVMKAGLLEQLELHIVPVVLGDGQRLFDAGLDLADDQGIELTPTRVIGTPEVTHIRYSVEGPATLVLDDRGSGGDVA
jgi:dihydrofolate reductase